LVSFGRIKTILELFPFSISLKNMDFSSVYAKTLKAIHVKSDALIEEPFTLSKSKKVEN